MEIWTVMVITVLSGYLDGAQFGIPYPSERACREAVAPVTESLDYDYSVDCRVTGPAVSTVRPMPRPEGL